MEPASGATTSALADALAAHADRLMPCVHCGFCLPACPTYTRLGDEADSPRGRLYLMRAVVEGRLAPASSSFQTHIDRCLGCRACETVCPSGVEYGSLLELARAEATKARRPKLLTRMLLAAFASQRATRILMVMGLALRLTGLPALAARILPSARPFGRMRFAMAMLAASKPWKRWGGVPLRDARPVERRVSALDPARGAPSSEEATETRVSILEGCVQRWLFAPVNAATLRVLEVNGCHVERVHGQGCCGALHAHGGDLETARALARRNIDAFGEAEVEQIIVNAAGCGAAMKTYGHLLENDSDYAERARLFALRVRDVSELLAERGPVTGAPLPVHATYDAPCHLLHAQRVGKPPKVVLASVPGLALHPLEGEDECCGGAGIYGLTHAELGGRIGRDKAEAVERSEADVLVTGNPGCSMQIGAWLRLTGSHVRTAHLVEVLDESYRRAGYYP